MSNVTGDNWTHSRNAVMVEGVEYFNYSNRDITITDRLGIEREILSSTERPERLEDRGKVIVRITRAVDPRRVTIPSVESQLECDQKYLIAFKEKIEQLKTKFLHYASEQTQVKYVIQYEMVFDFLSDKKVYKSNLLGITIRETTNIVERSHGDSPLGYINDVIVKELDDLEQEADGYVEKGIRTVFSGRLIDNNNRIGTLWTNVFGNVSKIIPIKDKEQKDGLYLAGGLRLEDLRFIPIDDLLDPKKLLSLNLHPTERDAKKHSTGDHTTSVMSDNEKLKKERSELKTEVKKLNDKVDDLEVKIKVEKINKAHSDFKNTVTIEKIKEYGADNNISAISRLITTVLTNVKVLGTFLQLFKLI